MVVYESALLRQELLALRSNREKMKVSRRQELERLRNQYETVQQKLKRNLSERFYCSTYRQFLRQYHLESIGSGKEANRPLSPCSNYIIQQETPFLSAIHRTFCILPHQMEVLENVYDSELYPFFRKEIQAIHIDKLKVSDYWMKRLSDQVECNAELYKNYREIVEKEEAKIKEYKAQLSKLGETKKKHRCHPSGTLYDEESTASGTEYSSDSESDISQREICPRKDGAVGKFRSLFLQFTMASPFRSKTIPS